MPQPAAVTRFTAAPTPRRPMLCRPSVPHGSRGACGRWDGGRCHCWVSLVCWHSHHSTTEPQGGFWSSSLLPSDDEPLSTDEAGAMFLFSGHGQRSPDTEHGGCGGGAGGSGPQGWRTRRTATSQPLIPSDARCCPDHRPLPRCAAWDISQERDEGHKGQGHAQVFTVTRKPHLASENWRQAMCLRDLVHSKSSDSPFLIPAEDWQPLQKQDSDVGVSRQEQEMEVCCLNTFCTLCKQIQAQLPPIALLTTLTSGTPLCFLG